MPRYPNHELFRCTDAVTHHRQFTTITTACVLINKSVPQNTYASGVISGIKGTVPSPAEFTLDGAIGSAPARLKRAVKASRHATNGVPFGCTLPLTVPTDWLLG
jgi:hypothetical protein